MVARDAFAAGESHILWGTLDMMVLFAPDLMKDSRTAPRIYQQIDWSNGGDGIVVRGNIHSVEGPQGQDDRLRPELARRSTSSTTCCCTPASSPSEVKHKYTATAFEAAAAFVADKSIDACVSWAPDIYNIPEKVTGTRILTTTAEANKLIADVWAARADFAKDHPEIVKGLVAGIFEGMDRLEGPDVQGQGVPVDGRGLRHAGRRGRRAWRTTPTRPTSPRTRSFFLNANDPTNFERTWKNITFVYRELGPDRHAGPLRRGDGLLGDQAARRGGHVQATRRTSTAPTFAPTTLQEGHGRGADPHPDDPHQLLPELGQPLRAAARRARQAPIANTLYDPSVEATLEKVARLAGQYERAVIAVVGHTDSSMKGKGRATRTCKQLSRDRADAVKQALVKKYKFDPNKFIVEGKGWDEPADPDDPMNQALNRRVEISVYPPEAK